ncbi:ABC transporter ATP-binding protein [Microbispora rosea subsp. aerata]|nr:ATP-binding cassette domain-containing protein [Microbispora rosea]GGO20613.1 ABC transporter ATP-binding protein [Microbispora rosea subsp. aerata]GIH57121.1 ABC transporter ATP-binding protein [Microbispora rosea subsp. aerata]GLJ84809.1 ABC transporter ATP-binding protein [Microbispora rosea subsp. aerata]
MTAVHATTKPEVPVLEVRDLAVHFGGVKAVDGLSFSLTAGKIFGVLGPNGSGKSTMLAAVTRLVRLTRGELLFGGEPYHHEPPRAMAGLGIARTFQTVRLLEDRTVRENVLLATDDHLIRGRAARRAVAERVDQAIERVGLTKVRRLRPTELSYGMQRRVEIARAIAMNPRLLLLDEPTAGMNRQEREDISALMRGLQAEGLTQLIIEHDVQMMVDTCDHLFAMTTGKLIAEGEPRAVVRHPAVQEAYLGSRHGRGHARA